MFSGDAPRVPSNQSGHSVVVVWGGSFIRRSNPVHYLVVGFFRMLRNVFVITVLVPFAASIGLLPRALAQRGKPAESPRFVIERDGATIAIEPYSPNIVRVSFSVEKAAALAPPGYGFTGTQSGTGWTRESGPGGDETLRSARLNVRLAPQSTPPPRAM